MIESFARAKFDLYSRGSRFICEEACPRYGCKGDLRVSAGLFEILAQGRILNRSMADLLRLAYRLSPFADAGLSKVRIRFTLRKPCLFRKSAGRALSTKPVPRHAPFFLSILPSCRRRREGSIANIAAWEATPASPMRPSA